MNEQEWRDLGALRLTLLLLLRAWEDTARSLGIELQQYMALLALRIAPLEQGQYPTTMMMLAHLLLREENSTVELVDRLEARGLVHRERDKIDNRRVFVFLTTEGTRMVEEGAQANRRATGKIGLSLVKAILAVMDHKEEEE